jgi:uncharacterized protein (TIGR02147 family)
MPNLYDYKEYKVLLRDKLTALDGKRGQYHRLAKAINASTTMISQILNGTKDASLEMASDLADYVGLTEQESEYLFLLVLHAKATHWKLKKRHEAQIERMREAARQLENRLPNQQAMTEGDRATFYSSWIYSGVRNLVATDRFQTVEAIAEYLRLKPAEVKKVIDFLLGKNLLKSNQKRWVPGPSRTHLGADSPFVIRHHQNWRLLGFQKMEMKNKDNLFYTAAMSISENLADELRQELPNWIEQLNRRIAPSRSEVVRCLNLDWFEY